ncbi:MAG: hypothetical protein AAB731_02315 [Patescibacteria group bacterium]
MNKLFRERLKKPQKEAPSIKTNRQLLEKKVERGTDLAIREYRDVFIKLAEYDQN